MEEINAFQTTDGEIFEDREEADLHEREYQLELGLIELCNREHNEKEIWISDIPKFIMDRRETLMELFKNWQGDIDD